MGGSAATSPPGGPHGSGAPGAVLADAMAGPTNAEAHTSGVGFAKWRPESSSISGYQR